MGQRRRAKAVARSGCDQRRGGREFQNRRAGAVRTRLRVAAGDQSASRLLLDHRLRQDGPSAHRPGYDFAIQGMGGLMSITGEPGGEPQKVGVAVTDIMTGMYATIAVLGALRARDASGEGQQIDLALLDVQVAYLANQASSYLVSGKVPTRLGNAHPSIVPYQAFATADGWIVLAVGNDEQFRRWAALAGCTRPSRRRAVSHQRRPHPQSRRAGAADQRIDAHPSKCVVDRTLRRSGRALRPDQRPGAGLRRSASAASRHADRPGASVGRHRARRAQPDPLRRDADRPTNKRRRPWASTPIRCWRICWGWTRTRSRNSAPTRRSAETSRLTVS